MVYLQVTEGASVAVESSTLDGPFALYVKSYTVGPDELTYGTVLVTPAGAVKVSSFDPVASAVVTPGALLLFVLALLVGRIL